MVGSRYRWDWKELTCLSIQIASELNASRNVPFSLCVDDWCPTGIDVRTIRIVVFASLFGVGVVCAVAVCAVLLYRRLTSTNGLSKWTPATTRIKIRYFFFSFQRIAQHIHRNSTQKTRKEIKKKKEKKRRGVWERERKNKILSCRFRIRQPRKIQNPQRTYRI